MWQHSQREWYLLLIGRLRTQERIISAPWHMVETTCGCMTLGTTLHIQWGWYQTHRGKSVNWASSDAVFVSAGKSGKALITGLVKNPAHALWYLLLISSPASHSQVYDQNLQDEGKTGSRIHAKYFYLLLAIAWMGSKHRPAWLGRDCTDFTAGI